MKLLNKYIVAVLLFVGVHSACGQNFQAGERLDYRVAYIAKLIPNTEVGYVIMETTSTLKDGKDLLHINGVGRTMSFFRWFFDLNDVYDVWLDPQTMRPLIFEDSLHEEKYTFRSRYDFDWTAMKVSTWAQTRQEAPRSAVLDLTEDSMDAISLYYNMRSVDRSEIQEGYHKELKMVLDKCIKYLKLRFIGREVCKVPKMGKFHTLRFACTLGSVDEFSFTDGSEFDIWITDDDNKFPVMLSSPIRVGRVRAYIHEYSGLKYPVTSRID